MVFCLAMKTNTPICWTLNVNVNEKRLLGYFLSRKSYLFFSLNAQSLLIKNLPTVQQFYLRAMACSTIRPYLGEGFSENSPTSTSGLIHSREINTWLLMIALAIGCLAIAVKMALERNYLK